MAASRRGKLAGVVVRNTTVRRVTNVAKPSRQSLTHHATPNIAPTMTPKAMKKNQKIHPNSERTTVLLKTKMGSPSINLLKIQSKSKFTAKRVMPSKRPLANPSRVGKRKTVEIPAVTQIVATTSRAFLNDGRKNKDE